MKQTQIKDFREIKDIHHSLLESEIDVYFAIMPEVRRWDRYHNEI